MHVKWLEQCLVLGKLCWVLCIFCLMQGNSESTKKGFKPGLPGPEPIQINIISLWQGETLNSRNHIRMFYFYKSFLIKEKVPGFMGSWLNLFLYQTLLNTCTIPGPVVGTGGNGNKQDKNFKPLWNLHSDCFVLLVFCVFFLAGEGMEIWGTQHSK